MNNFFSSTLGDINLQRIRGEFAMLCDSPETALRIDSQWSRSQIRRSVVAALHTKPGVLLMSTLWIWFVLLYQTHQSPISLYSCSSINLCLTLIFAIHNLVCKQLSSMFLNSFQLPATLWFQLNQCIMPELYVQKKISFNTIKNCKKVEIV